MDFQCVFWNGRTEKHQTSTARFRLAEENGQHRPFPSLACVLPHPLQNRVPRVQVLLPLPKKSGIALAVPDFFVSERKDLAARFARRPACGACRGGLQPGGLRPGPTEPAGETSPSAPATKPAETLGFCRFSFCTCCIAIWCILVRISGFPPVRTGCTPPQHPKRTRSRLFLAESGAFSSFLLFFWHKIFVPIFVHLAA